MPKVDPNKPKRVVLTLQHLHQVQVKYTKADSHFWHHALLPLIADWLIGYDVTPGGGAARAFTDDVIFLLSSSIYFHVA